MPAQHNVMMVANSQHLLKQKAIKMFVLVKIQLKMLCMYMVMYKLPFQYIMISRFINLESINMFGDHMMTDMLLHSLVMVKKMAQNTGEYKTHGVQIGVKMVSLELSEVLMNVVLKIHATRVIIDRIVVCF